MRISQLNKLLIVQFMAVLSALFLVYHYSEHCEEHYLKREAERNLLGMMRMADEVRGASELGLKHPRMIGSNGYGRTESNGRNLLSWPIEDYRAEERWWHKMDDSEKFKELKRVIQDWCYYEEIRLGSHAKRLHDEAKEAVRCGVGSHIKELEKEIYEANCYEALKKVGLRPREADEEMVD